jgi:septum formation protein
MLQDPTRRLILASASQSRCALLAAAGLAFEVRPAEVDEAAIKRAARAEGVSPEVAAMRLADRKAQAIGALVPEALVIGADQILVCEGAWFDKPADMAAARTQLCALRGRSHVLASAAACWQGGRSVWQGIATPRLLMRDFSDRFLDCYLAAEAGTVTGTVGAYRVEGRGAQLFDAIEGEHAAVLGLPLLALLSFFRAAGILMA